MNNEMVKNVVEVVGKSAVVGCSLYTGLFIGAGLIDMYNRYRIKRWYKKMKEQDKIWFCLIFVVPPVTACSDGFQY